MVPNNAPIYTIKRLKEKNHELKKSIKEYWEMYKSNEFLFAFLIT